MQHCNTEPYQSGHSRLRRISEVLTLHEPQLRLQLLQLGIVPQADIHEL